MLGTWLSSIAGTRSFYRWLPISAERSLIALVTQTAQAGITIASPGARQQVGRGTLGICLCLGHPSSDDMLESALLKAAAFRGGRGGDLLRLKWPQPCDAAERLARRRPTR
jgi:hypothetical protein